jgi:glycosyltransferase involved in cell wall biosynthesis
MRQEAVQSALFTRLGNAPLERCMKILFLTQHLGYGGAERQLVVLAKGLQARGHDVVVSVFYPDGPLEKELQGSGVRVRSLGKRSRWHLASFLVTFINMVRAERPAIIHGYLGEPNIFSLIPKLLVPGVKVVWGIRDSHMDFSNDEWIIRVNARLARWLSRFPDCIITNSHAGLQYHASQGYPRHTMTVVHNGIDTDRFRPNAVARRQVRAEWGVTPGDRVIGLIARLHPMKDHPVFLTAAADLAREHQRVMFVCVGNGRPEYRDSLLKLANSLGLKDRVLWLNPRPDVEAVFAALDIAVSSSQFGEGFGNAIAEAMACGVPCVVTDVGDSALIVGDKGKVVPARNPAALKAAIDEVLRHQPYTAEATRQRIVDRVSVHRLISNTEEALDRINGVRQHG